jgi:hypothetical protein
MDTMSDLSELKEYLDRKAEEDRAFQRSLVERNRPKTAMQQDKENRDLISSGHAQAAEARAAQREEGDAE